MSNSAHLCVLLLFFSLAHFNGYVFVGDSLVFKEVASFHFFFYLKLKIIKLI